MPMVAPVPTRLIAEMTISTISESRSSQRCDWRFLARRPRARARGRFLCGARRDLQNVWYDVGDFRWPGVYVTKREVEPKAPSPPRGEGSGERGERSTT